MRFGTDGIRGPAGLAPVDVDGARRVGAAAAAWARTRGPEATVFVGRDPRPSGASLAAAVLEGAERAGARALDLGVVSSPVVAFAVAALGADAGAAGVVVTASHNPAADNGFKVLGPGGLKPDDGQVAALEGWLADPPAAPGGRIEDDGGQAQAAYAQAFVGAVGDLSPLRGRRLVVDLAAGAALACRPWLRALLGEVELHVVGVHGEVNAGCGSEHPEALVAAVRAVGADAGLAVDGDADRALLVDAAGRVVPGDSVIGLLTAGLRPRRVAVSVMSTAAFEGWFPEVVVERTPVGDRHLVEAVVRRGAGLGAEESGHVVLADAWPSADGLLVGLRALVLAFARWGSVAAAADAFVPWPRRAGKIRAAVRVPVEALPGVPEAVRSAEAAVAPGRVLVRWSGTEPALRVMVEGPDAASVAGAYEALRARCAEALS